MILSSAIFLAIVQQQPSPHPSVQYGRLIDEAGHLVSDRKFTEAEKSYRAALKIFDQDGQVWLSLGQAAALAKDYDTIIESADKVLSLGGFGAKVRATALFEKACALVAKNDLSGGWKSLEAAMAAGYRNVDSMRKDSRLAPLHSKKGWEEMTGSKDVKTMSRVEGWQYDLWFLDRELRRIHYSPYLKHTAEERNQMVRALRDRIPTLTDDQIKVEMYRYVATFGDGHTNIRLNPFVRSQVQIFWFQEGFYVTMAPPAQKELVGGKIVQIEGHPIDGVVRKVEPLISHENPQGIRSSTPGFIVNPVILAGLGLRSGNEGVKVTVEKAGGSKVEGRLQMSDQVAPGADWVKIRDKEDARYLKNRALNYWFEELPEIDAIYFQYNAVQNQGQESLAKFTDRLFKAVDDKKVKRLIVDVRWNGGGNTFLSQPIVKGIVSRPAINRNGGLYVITGRNTYSAAQNFTTDLSRSTTAIFVGEPTGSSPNFIGESIPYSLPYSGLKGTISDLYWQRSWPMDDRIWIAPDLPALPTFAAHAAGKDLAMEAILANILAEKK